MWLSVPHAELFMLVWRHQRKWMLCCMSLMWWLMPPGPLPMTSESSPRTRTWRSLSLSLSLSLSHIHVQCTSTHTHTGMIGNSILHVSTCTLSHCYTYRFSTMVWYVSRLVRTGRMLTSPSLLPSPVWEGQLQNYQPDWSTSNNHLQDQVLSCWVWWDTETVRAIVILPHCPGQAPLPGKRPGARFGCKNGERSLLDKHPG